MRVTFKATVRGLFTLNTMYCFDAHSWFTSSRSFTPKHQDSFYADELIKDIKRPKSAAILKDKEIFKTIKIDK